MNKYLNVYRYIYIFIKTKEQLHLISPNSLIFCLNSFKVSQELISADKEFQIIVLQNSTKLSSYLCVSVTGNVSNEPLLQEYGKDHFCGQKTSGFGLIMDLKISVVKKFRCLWLMVNFPLIARNSSYEE